MSKLQLPKLIPYDVLTKYSTKIRNIIFHAIDVSTSIGHYVLCELLRYRALPTVSSAMCFTVDDHTAR